MRPVVVIALLFCFASIGNPVLGQVPMPGQGGMPAPAPPETLVVWLAAPDGDVACSLRFDDAPIRFGAPWTLEVTPVAGASRPDSLTVSVPWMTVQIEDVDGGFVARAMRAGPFRLGWNRDPASLSGVLLVEGRLGPGDGPEPVRDPWRLERRRWPLLVAALIALAAMAAVWRWRARKDANEIERIAASNSGPAWTGFMVEAAELADAGLPDGPGARSTLDRLDRLIRRYLLARYGIDATALAPGEIDKALTERSYPAGSGRVFDAILGELDIRRYEPATETPLGSTRRLLGEALDAVETSEGARSASGSSARAELAGEAARGRLRRLLGGGEAP
jgi:hypothetical protein